MLRRRLVGAGLGALLVASCGVAGCRPLGPAGPDFGVSLELARDRAQRIRDLRYDLHFRIPATRSAPVTGEVTIRFALASVGNGLALDFRGDSSSVTAAEVNGASVAVRLVHGHVVIPSAALRAGANEVSLGFASGDDALNRNDEFLYALFVPDRAATAFPSFDQPDLKARYRLRLDVPPGWRALANGAELSRDSAAAGVTVVFAETEPLSTYLFAYAAGRFAVEEAVRDGRTLTMLHRETDTAKVARNREAIFDLHAAALRWLEDYTGIPYPFGKFAFLAVPAFQFGGMEHPGAVWYRASSLFLDPSATRSQQLGRASVIAHEAAHMWFGDLVTMRWFSDVWMKEVFANFMAAKIVRPSFPDVNHDLRFVLAHHPAAYAVDRTPGANPIRQELANLRQAGSLYGAIIYQKAPIVMRQLERLIGERAFRDGLRTYLDRYKFGNASWPDLIEILDAQSSEDLAGWSEAWVSQPFRPQIEAAWSDRGLLVTQRDPNVSRGLRWNQTVEVAVGFADTIVRVAAPLADEGVTVPLARETRPAWVLPGSDGVAYGRFGLDSASRKALLADVSRLSDPVMRTAAWLALWESLLSGQLAPLPFLDAVLVGLEREQDELIAQHLLGLVRTTFWRLLDDPVRAEVAPRLEAALWGGLDRARTPSARGAYWNAIVAATFTAEGTARLEAIRSTRIPPAGLPLAEAQYTALAEALALRAPADAERILTEEEARITNPDRLARFRFVRPALAADPAIRDSVFEAIRSVDNRRRESWVLDAVAYLAHPLRAGHAQRYLGPGLGLLEEIEATGDIFFPLNWLNALLDGHRSAVAASVVDSFLTANPAMPQRLRGKLLQAGDDLFRAARIVEGWTGGPTLEGDVRLPEGRPKVAPKGVSAARAGLRARPIARAGGIGDRL